MKYFLHASILITHCVSAILQLRAVMVYFCGASLLMGRYTNDENTIFENFLFSPFFFLTGPNDSQMNKMSCILCVL